VFKHTESAARELATKLDDRGLRAADIYLQTATDFVSLAPNHREARRRRKARDLFTQTLDFASACGSAHVSALPGVRFAEEPRGVSLARAADELAWRAALAADRGIAFSVEAHVGSIASRPKQALELVRRTPGLTLTLDYTHFTKLGIADAEIEPLVAYASHFHARGACQGRLQASLKDNTIDYARVWQAMCRSNYGGYVGIEYVWIDWEHCNEVDNLSETILLRDFFRSQARRSAPRKKGPGSG
jgi:sugar phosphate isomerase/epimerase